MLLKLMVFGGGSGCDLWAKLVNGQSMGTNRATGRKLEA
jgi:hypothetical protein